MKGTATLLLGFLVGLSPALAGETTTVAVVRLGEQPVGGRWVTTETGRRGLLKGPLALAVAHDSEVFTVAGTPQNGVLRPTWVLARTSARIQLARRRHLKVGTVVKVVETRIQSGQREYRMELGGLRSWVPDYKLDFAPASAPIESTRVAGRVELTAGRLSLLTQHHGRLSLLGTTKWLLRSQVGRFVEGEGLVLRRSKKLLLTELDGETIEQTEVFPSVTGTKDGMPRAAGDRLRLVKRSDDPARLELRFNWPSTGEGPAYIPASKVSIGKPWEEVTGELKRSGKGGYSVMTSCGHKALDPSSFNNTLPTILAPYVGRTITVGGALDSLGVLHVRSLSAHTHTLSLGSPTSLAPPEPLRITGVTLDAERKLAYVVTTPKGDAQVLPRFTVRLTEGKAPGAAAALEQLR